MSLLVTGATGFIGRHFVKDVQVKRLVVREFCPELARYEQYIIKDIVQCPDDGLIFEGCDTVMYFAGIAHEALSNATDDRIDKVNHQAVCDFARLAASYGIKRFVFLSSTIVYGITTSSSPISEKTSVFPNNTASRAKIECEQNLLEISQSCDMEVVIIRSPLVYGEGVKGNLFRLIKWIEKATFLPFGRVRNKRHYISVENLVKTLENFTCLSFPVSNEIFVVADRDAISTKELVERLAIIQKKNIKNLPIPIVFFKLASLLLGKKSEFELIFGDLTIDSGKYRKRLSERVKND
ncbi:NAD-dependent epimerase/dehydratase family protein [Salinivibrio proteolyticus]|uniref:NAD-dependent epimerase/dehydratase family protein n=1 Tax=Salinivibrio proteolyticus TaxID=334715 RepID=A0ABY7L9N6_9GAMM|nr:NAD-dependent epimerase/dehydratase family protein [Salinivibrio proteolyticus]WBA13971.1 NAD-dependent epimerase/dehydratase family protein [Salinivibrio proteolyticus]